jgi:hypothetical protein
VTHMVKGKTDSNRIVRRQRVPVFQLASFAFYRKSMGHTVVERSWKDADILCISCI